MSKDKSVFVGDISPTHPHPGAGVITWFHAGNPIGATHCPRGYSPHSFKDVVTPIYFFSVY